MALQEVRKARTATAILDAAERLFERQGYAASTINAIAREADVATGSIYFHFKGKEEVYLALVERILDVNEQVVDEALAGGGPSIERVLAVGDAYLRFHRDHPLAFRLIGLRDVGRSDDPRVRDTRTRVAARLDAMVDQVAGPIAEGVAAGELRDVDPRDAAVFLWGSWNGVLALHARGTLDERGLRDVLALGREVLAAGLVAP
jgi:TetR/AcrR family transcriptional regulator